MTLSIIVTHYKAVDFLCNCLDSIRKTVKDIDHEVFVVDAKSKKKTENLIKKRFPEVNFMPFKKDVGYSKSVNSGIKKTKGNYVLIVNADIVFLENAVSKMLKFMKKNPDVGLIGPQLINPGNKIQISCFSDPTIKAIIARRTPFGKTKWGKKASEKFTISDWDRKSKREVDWVQGSAMMIQRPALEKIGLLDDRFFMYFEDADWCRRFRNNSYKVIYLSDAKMKHAYHRASKKWGPILDLFLNFYTRIHIISAIKYFWKYR